MATHKGDQVYAHCPNPDHGPDRKPSLSVTWSNEARGGKTMIRCFGGCSFRDVVAALGLRQSDTFDSPPARPVNADEQAEREKRSRRQERAAQQKRPAPSVPAEPVVAEPVKTWDDAELEATYTYVSADGVPVFDVRRWANAPVKYSARSYTVDGRRVAASKMPKLDRRVLYRLPEVLAAVKAGALVYVVEGEKDSDSLATRARVCATTNPSGAYTSKEADSSKWLPQYTEALRGAHVVLVADVDPLTPRKGYPGYRHVLNVASELDGIAASVSAVRPREGKDATDHLAAGYGVDDFEPVELETLAALVAVVDQVHAEHGVYVVDAATPAVAPDPEPDTEAGGRVIDFPSGLESVLDHQGLRGGGGGGGGGGNSGDGGSGEEEQPWTTVTIEDQFEQTPEGIFKVVTDHRKRLVKRMPLLSVPVKVVARYSRLLPDGGPAIASHFDLEATRDGEIVRLQAIDLERWERGTWVNDLPWLVPAKRHQAGRSLLREAIEKTSGADIPLTPLYGALGWQEFRDRWVYVHAGGAIDANGVVDGIEVKVPAVLEPFELPEPPTTMEDLQRAVYASVALMDAAPARLAAPLLGAAYRACLGYSQTTVSAVGSPATGKTSFASIVAQHFAPSSRHRRMPGPGAGENAATINGLAEVRFLAGDVLLPMDDLAPDKGPEKASERLAAIARSQFNREGKDKMTRKSELMTSHPPRSMPLVTGEQSTSVFSAETRLALLRFLPGDLDLSPHGPVAELSRGTAPMDRASLTAAMVRYYAPRMPLTGWLDSALEELTDALADPEVPESMQGLDQRAASVVAELAVGWRAMLDMAVALNAINESTAAELWNWAWEGLAEAKRLIAAGQAGRTPADRLRELVGALLVTRRVALHSREGGTPVNPEDYGWELNSFDGGYRVVGEPVGWTDGQKFWFLPSALFPHLERQANGQNEPLNLTKEGLAQRLADENVITVPPRVDANGNPTKGPHRNMVQRRIAGKALWVWEFDRDWLFPPEAPEDPEAGDPQPLPIAPIPPAPAPRPEAPSQPSLPREEAKPEPAVTAAQSPAESPVAAPAPTRPRKPAKAAQGGTAPSSVPSTTYLTTWLREQYPGATTSELEQAEQFWVQAMRGVEFRGPFDTAKRILNGALRHQSIPDLPKLDLAQLNPAMTEVPGSGDLRPDWWRSRTRTMGEALTEGAWVTSFDVNGFYPSAADIDLGTGDPVLTEAAKLPHGWQKQPGWVQLAEPATAAPYGLDDRLTAGLWVPVPLAAYLDQKGALPAVKASLLWPDSRRWLRPHVTMFREARSVLTELEADSLAARMTHRAVKATNTRLFGGALRSKEHNDTLTLRLDWASMIESTAEARMYRALDKVDQAAARVIAKHVDAAWFEVASPEIVPPGLVVSDQYGKFKPVGCARVTPQMIEAHRVGRWKTIYDELEKSEGRK